jgi:autotransporter passenger strand-loop-strand repeat protein
VATYNLPGDEEKVPKNLLAEDELNVNANGISRNITIQDAATEYVNTGGKAIDTTVNEGGLLRVEGGTIDTTTINGGIVRLSHGTADHTTLNFSLQAPFSRLEVHDGSVVKNTVITGGSVLGETAHGLLVDATSTAENVEFRDPNDPYNKFSGGGLLALENPLGFKGDIKGLSVGDFIQFGGLGLGENSPSITVKDFEVTKKNDLIITYDDATQKGLQVTYHLQAMQPNTTFQLQQKELDAQHHFSMLTVIDEKTAAWVAAESALLLDTVSLVGYAHGHAPSELF